MRKRAAWRHNINKKVVFGAVGALIFFVLLIVGAFWNGQAIVDIVIVLAALMSLVAFALLGFAALQIIDLVKEVRGEVKTLMGTAQTTMTEVQGTARFISDNLVQPVSQAVGFISAARATARSFTDPLFKRKG